MAEKNDFAGSNQPSSPDRRVLVNIQYIKDFSFENPNSPESLVPPKEQPKIEVSVDVRVEKMEDNTFEVILLTTAKAVASEKILFMTELAYAGIFTIHMPKEELEPVLMVYCPGLLFPFARQIIADVTRQGGFPPLMIDPIDFGALYKQHIKQRIKHTANNDD